MLARTSGFNAASVIFIPSEILGRILISLIVLDLICKMGIVRAFQSQGCRGVKERSDSLWCACAEAAQIMGI